MKKEILFSTATIISFISLTVFFSCSKGSSADQQQVDASSSIPRAGNSRQGVVYIESNDAQQNSILSYFQNSNGTLTYFATTASGGAGTGTALHSQSALQADETHHWLFAVNAGSNSISSFSINSDGSLVLLQTISSNGTFPVSLTVFGDWLYVVNSASANISGFTIGTGGKLTYIAGSNQSLSSGSATPAQIKFTPDRHLIVTEKMTNKIITYPVNTSGVAGPGSFCSSLNSTPYGFAISHNNIIVTEAAGGAAGASTVSCYRVASYLTNNSTTSPVCGPIHAGQTSACGVVTTADGNYAYIINGGSNTITSFSANTNGILQLMNKVEATTGLSPADISFSNNESYLYVINTMSHSISEYKKTPNESLHSIGEVTGLPANATGLVAL